LGKAAGEKYARLPAGKKIKWLCKCSVTPLTKLQRPTEKEQDGKGQKTLTHTYLSKQINFQVWVLK